MKTQYDSMVETAANKHGNPPSLLWAQIYHESSFNPTARSENKDSAGRVLSVDRGIAQINDKAHPEVSDTQAYNPAWAIEWMAQTMAARFKTYGDWSKALISYNAGHYGPDTTWDKVYADAVFAAEKFSPFNQTDSKGSDKKVAFQSAIAQLNGKSYLAVAVDDETYPIWTMAQDAEANLTKVAYGDVEIDGKKPRQVTDGKNTYIHYADIVPVLTPHLLPGGGFNFTTPVHNYELTVDEEDSEIAGRWALITITTLDDGKPFGHQLVKISQNGTLVCSDYTDDSSGGYEYAITETTDKVDTVIVVWQDPAGKVHTSTKTTKFSVPKVTPTPLPSDDSIVVQFPLLPTSDVSNAILFSAKSLNGQDLTWQLDTGAFELCLNAADAKTLSAPNLGTTTMEGVGGQSEGYYSQVTFTINGVTFKDVPCIVNPSFTLNSLFGERFFIDNQYDLLISQKHNTVTFCK